MPSEMIIGKRTLARGRFQRPYIIAEAGVNHEGSLDVAMEMVRRAAQAGADAVKFQTYTAETLASRHSPSYWDTSKEPTRSQYELFKKYDRFGDREYERLAQVAAECGVDFLSTPFDLRAVDMLEPLVPAYKIASADITNLPLLRRVAQKGKPILLSTGASTVSEIHRALEIVRAEGNEQVALLHCVLNYPTAYQDANLGMIAHMRRIFPDHVIGYSDHTPADRMDEVLLLAWLLGAQVLEKHYTHDKTLPGNDHYHAMDADDLARFVGRVQFAEVLFGSDEKRYLPSEEAARAHARRSVVAARRIPKGATISPEDVICKRPGTGIPPTLYDFVVGGTALADVDADEVLTFDKVRLRTPRPSDAGE